MRGPGSRYLLLLWGLGCAGGAKDGLPERPDGFVPDPETGAPEEETGETAEAPAPADAPEDDAPELIPGDDASEELDEVPALWSHARGLYDAPFALTLRSPVDAGEILYTLDGSDPAGVDGLLYTEPLSIASTTVVRVAVLDGYEVLVPTETRTFLFPADIPAQEAPPGWPEDWWEDEEGGPYTADYAMDAEITGGEAWALHEAEVWESLLVVSLTVPPEDLFGPSGIHEHPLERGVDWERAGSVELFGEGLDDVGVGCGVRIHGGAGRRPDRSPKKSFRVLFKSEYGPGELEHPVFEEGEVQDFDTLVLRAGYNRAWVNWQDTQRERADYARERLVTTLARDMGATAPRVRPAHLFLDGIYWGIYQIEERPDASFLAETLGGEEEAWDALNSGEVVDGDSAAWEALQALVEADLSDPAAYTAVGELLDLEGFADYMILNLGLGNTDWPAKNWWAGRRRADGERWRFFIWDAELTMVYLDDDVLSVSDEGTPGEIFQALRANEEFRVLFGDRAHLWLQNDGALSPDALAERWAELSAPLDPGVLAESARWGDHWRDARGEDTERYTYEEHWLAEIARVDTEYLPFRGAIFLDQLRAGGLYPEVEAPALTPFGGTVGAADEITLTAPEGEIWARLDGGDPREEGGGIAPEAARVEGPITLSVSASLRARAITDAGWSALVQADFLVE